MTIRSAGRPEWKNLYLLVDDVRGELILDEPAAIRTSRLRVLVTNRNGDFGIPTLVTISSATGEVRSAQGQSNGYADFGSVPQGAYSISMPPLTHSGVGYSALSPTEFYLGEDATVTVRLDPGTSIATYTPDASVPTSPPVTIRRMDLALDLADQGLWTSMEGSTPSILHGLNPKVIASGNMDGNPVDELVVDFGAPHGIWVRWNGSAWTILHGMASKSMIFCDVNRDGRKEVLVDFEGMGVWHYNHGFGWAQVSGMSPRQMLAIDMDGGGDEIVFDFPGIGIWIRKQTGEWYQLHSLNPGTMAAGDFDGNGRGDLAIAFNGPHGIWIHYNASSWTFIHPYPAGRLAAGNVNGGRTDELIVDFAPLGLWSYSIGAWRQLHSTPTRHLLTADINGDGMAEVIADFGAAGIWRWSQQISSWLAVASQSAEAIVAGHFN